MLLSVPSVVATPTSKPATGTRNKCATDQPVNVAQPTFILLMFFDRFNNPISSIPAGQPYDIRGFLMAGDLTTAKAPTDCICGAKVHVIVTLNPNGNLWIPAFTQTTGTGQDAGLFAMRFPGQDPAGTTLYFKATYDGDIGYYPCSSNVVSVSIV